MSDQDETDPREYPVMPLLAVSAAVFRDGQVLIAKRGIGPRAGLWSLPGGLVEPGEPMAEAAVREVEEETGIDAEIVGPADFVEVITRDEDDKVSQHYVVVCFAARWLGGDGAISAEASDIIWTDPDALGELEMTEGAPEAIARAAALVNGG